MKEEISMKKLLTLILALMLTVSLAACGNGSNQPGAPSDSGAPAPVDSAPAGGSIRFAVIGPMTGDAASQGQQQEYGVRLAVEEINAAGGVNGKMLEYDIFDDQLIPNQAVICAEKIVADSRYDFVIAPVSSGCTLAAYPTFDNADMLVISATNTADHLTTQGFQNFLRICPTAGGNLVQLVELAAKDYGVKAPAVFYTSFEVDSTSFDTCVKLLKEEYGVDVAASARVEADSEKDYNAHITNFLAAGADSVFCFSEYAPSALFVKQQHALGWDVQQFSLSGTSNPQFIEIAGAEAAEGFISMSAFDATNPDEKVRQFVTAYEELVKSSPGEWAAGGYDTVYIMADAIGNAGDIRGNKLSQWMKSNTSYSGITGNISFDEHGDNPSAKALILQVKDGKYVVAEP